VHRLAHAHHLDGWVANDPRGVVIEVEGEPAAVERFVEALAAQAPPPAAVDSLHRAPLEPLGETGFRIRHSDAAGEKTAQVLPDIATCPACLAEVLDPADRRHGYPFANCTHCGPRYSIVRSLPYDRPHTSMSGFEMCQPCRAEYTNPADRRFHAQPNACASCGPSLALWEPDGTVLTEGPQALAGAADALRSGAVLALKGLGGFHLMVDARDAKAVARLRERKPRREKPFALMVRDLEQARRLCRVDGAAAEALAAPEAPILLLPRRPDAPTHQSVAPGSPTLGIMLPCTPLHHLLLRHLDFPLVATSGNLSEEPICTDESEAAERLGGIADLLLVHDRPIQRHVDDSVAWVLRGETRLLRRARGFAPRPVRLAADAPSVLAVGGHLKNTVALSVASQVFVSQHIGDMETPQALSAFEHAVSDLLRLYQARPGILAHDLHPDYASTHWAVEYAADAGLHRVAVQHHHAHLAACLAENGAAGPALGVTWDGTGYGSDRSVWGGEFLLGGASAFRRVAHLHPFLLPGGEAAVREPRRAALALLWEVLGAEALERDDLEPVRSFDARERTLLSTVLERQLGSPVTTSAGRLFDGIAALIGPWQRSSFEGQAAMGLEFLADPGVADAYPVELSGGSTQAGDPEPTPLVLDWRPLLQAILEQQRRGVAPAVIAARFHNALIEAILGVARAVGEPTVALSGGCFQNRRLVEGAASGLEDAGFRVFLHRQVPPNDGGLSLGQVAVAAARHPES
jgi:hydrogenase maturation protein HypF